jgi:hypothetical protein
MSRLLAKSWIEFRKMLDRPESPKQHSPRSSIILRKLVTFASSKVDQEFQMTHNYQRGSRQTRMGWAI